MRLAEPCPQGYYCPAGSSIPIPCQNGTFSSVTHATSSAACGPAPPGTTAVDGVPYTYPCLPGYYCPGSSVQNPCAATTWNPVAGSSSVSDCVPCPAGYLCDEPGIANLSTYLCPTAHFCDLQVRVWHGPLHMQTLRTVW